MSIGRDLLNVPMGQMISEMALAIADSQLELDEASLRVAEMMSGNRHVENANGNVTKEDTRVFFGKDKDGKAEKLSMIELGFTPTFYQFTDTIIEVKMAIKMTRSTEYVKKTQGKQVSFSIGRGGMKVTSTPVDATYSSKYSYSAEGSSLLRTKLVPIPPPSILEERIQKMIDEAEAENED